MKRREALIFEQGAVGRRGVTLPPLEVEAKKTEELIPAKFLRTDLPLPELSEIEVVRHFTRLSTYNFGVDSGFYPLGSCTMKYNPKINEDVSRLEGLAYIHPYQDTTSVQGALELQWELEQYLCEICGMDAFTLQPAAGAHGELTGLLLIKAYFKHKGENRTKVLVPDSSHGTNPASAALLGYEVVNIASNERGRVDIEDLKKHICNDVAALMLTNPNTLGLFEDEILEITALTHKCGALLYYDGANANAILGYTRPGDLGFDVMHLNLHKTFSTPHGGGGPGSGPVGVKKFLQPYLPAPRVVKENGSFKLEDGNSLSIGKIKSFYGNFLVMLKAYAYIRSLGADGLKDVAQNAVLNANYLQSQLKDTYLLPYDYLCFHEFVLSAKDFDKNKHVKALHIAKRLLDYGIHAPTVYFPLIVKEALMIEPTETETKAALDNFIQVMKKIAQEEPSLVQSAPHCTPVGIIDEATAARKPDLAWMPAEIEKEAVAC